MIINMLKKEYLITALLAICILSGAGIAAASDITDADYFGVARSTNNGTVATNVSTVFTANTTAWIASGILNSSANNCAIRIAGVDTAFMPGYNSSTWVLFVESIPANSSNDATLYTGNVTGGKYALFGTLNAGDSAGMEPSDNGSAGMTAYLDTSQAGYEYLCKPGAYTVRNGSPSGNVTATIGVDDAFTADHWTDVGSKISVNSTAHNLGIDAERSATDARCYLDLGTVLSNTSWKLNFDWNMTASAGGLYYWGAWADNANALANVGDYIVLYASTNTVNIRASNGGSVNSSASAFTYANGTTYYWSLERGASGNLTYLSAYTNAGRSIHAAGSPITLAVSPTLVTNLRYIMASNYNDNSGASKQQYGWIDNVVIADVEQLVATGITAGEKPIVVSIENIPAGTTKIHPDADGTFSQWHELGGGVATHWEAVKDDPAIDGTYIRDYSRDGVWYKDTFTTSGVSGNGTITSVAVYYRYKEVNDAASSNSTPIIHVSGATYNGTINNNPDTNWNDYSYTWNTNPATGSAWTWAEVAAIEYGIQTITVGLGEARCSQVYAVISYATYNLVSLVIDGVTEDAICTNNSIRNTGNSLVIGSANATPYILSANVTKSGVLKASYAWNYNLTITDLSGNGNDATLTPRTTSSDPDVSAALISWTPISPSTASANAFTWPTLLVTAPTQPTSLYTENTTPGVFFRPFVHAIWTVGMPGINECFFWYGFSFFTIIAAGMLIFWAFAEKSRQAALLIKIILMMAIMIYWALPGPNIYGMYVPIYMGMWCFGILVMSRSYGW